MLVRSKRFIVICVLFLGIFLFFQYSNNKSYALAVSKNEYKINDLKTLTGEEIKQEGNIYKINVCNNQNKVEIIFNIENNNDNSKEKLLKYMNDLVAIGEDNAIAGEIDYSDDMTMIVNLNEGNNLIRIKNKEDNSEILKLSINYTKVKVIGIPDNINVGDNFDLKCSINKERYNDTKWLSYGIDTLIVSEDGHVTIVNGGTGRVMGTIYKDNKIVGSINISMYALGEGKLGWIKNDDKWYYIDPVKKHFKIGWLESNNNWYYMNKDGSMKTGWLNDNEHTYYFNEKGEMIKGKVTIDGKEYNFNNRGELI